MTAATWKKRLSAAAWCALQICTMQHGATCCVMLQMLHAKTYVKTAARNFFHMGACNLQFRS
jgi:hypothetical protein